MLFACGIGSGLFFFSVSEPISHYTGLFLLQQSFSLCQQALSIYCQPKSARQPFGTGGNEPHPLPLVGYLGFWGGLDSGACMAGSSTPSSVFFWLWWPTGRDCHSPWSPVSFHLLGTESLDGLETLLMYSGGEFLAPDQKNLFSRLQCDCHHVWNLNNPGPGHSSDQPGPPSPAPCCCPCHFNQPAYHHLGCHSNCHHIGHNRYFIFFWQ